MLLHTVSTKRGVSRKIHRLRLSKLECIYNFYINFLWGATFEIIDTIKNANYLNICAESVLQSNTKCLSKFAKKKILEEKFCRKFSSLTCIKTCILSNLTGFLGRNLL